VTVDQIFFLIHDGPDMFLITEESHEKGELMDQKQYDAILATAIAAEVEAQKFYAGLAGKVSDAYLRSMFLELVQEEQKHEKILLEFKADGVGHIHFKNAPDFKVSETLQRPEFSSDMKPADAVAVAMKNEEEAMNRYISLGDACTDPDQKKVFMELAAMEREHKNRMENAFVDIGYPEVW
jgi:rubrerythrin